MKANYKRKNSEPTYVKRTKDKCNKISNTKTKQDNKKYQRRISHKGIQ